MFFRQLAVLVECFLRGFERPLSVPKLREHFAEVVQPFGSKLRAPAGRENGTRHPGVSLSLVVRLEIDHHVVRDLLGRIHVVLQCPAEREQDVCLLRAEGRAGLVVKLREPGLPSLRIRREFQLREMLRAPGWVQQETPKGREVGPMLGDFPAERGPFLREQQVLRVLAHRAEHPVPLCVSLEPEEPNIGSLVRGLSPTLAQHRVQRRDIPVEAAREEAALAEDLFGMFGEPLVGETQGDSERPLSTRYSR